MFTRLLVSLLATGIAPDSFYRGTDGTRPTAHYDGLPVDFTAEAVDTIGAQQVQGYDTYHLLNPHEDGISLDTFVDWLMAAGYRIERVEDYAQWLRGFGDALRSLPEIQRRNSVLPLLHSYQQQAEPVPGGMAPAGEFRAAVRAAKIGAVGDIPHITRELILKYGTDLGARGLL
jgi:fatty acid CoA ligase FadD9